MNFQDMKKKQLSKIDKSSIGKWDDKIVGLCEKLNKMDDYYTTSSCGGRVVLIKSLDKKASDVFLFKTHDKIGMSGLKKALENAGAGYDGLVEFKMSGCILHVACSCLEDAQKLVDKAKLAGWKRSGIMTSGISGGRIIVELLSTENIEFIIMKNGKVLVDDDFLKLIVGMANKRLERVWEKIKKLEKLL